MGPALDRLGNAGLFGGVLPSPGVLMSDWIDVLDYASDWTIASTTREVAYFSANRAKTPPIAGLEIENQKHSGSEKARH